MWSTVELLVELGLKVSDLIYENHTPAFKAEFVWTAIYYYKTESLVSEGNTADFVLILINLVKSILPFQGLDRKSVV